MTDITALAAGTVAQTTQAYKSIPAGTRFVVEEFFAAPTPGDEWYGDDSFCQEAVYYGSNRGGMNNVLVPAQNVRAVPADQILAEESIISSVASALHGGDLDVRETSVDGSQIFVSGSDHGLPFAFTLTVADFDLHG